MTTYASKDLVAFGMVEEVAEGVLETASPVPLVLTDGISVDPSSTIIGDKTVSGAGESIDNRTNVRGIALKTPLTLRHGDVLPIMARQLRDVLPSAVTIVGSSNIDVVLAGTHRDGSTGPQLKAPTGTFDNFINYGGVSAATHPDGGGEGLLMRVSGFTNTENNWHRRIKSVWDDTSFAYIDIEPGYVGGSAGFFGEPMVAETLASATLSVGRAARNRIVGAGVKSYTALWQFQDMVNNGKFGAAWGLAAGAMSFGWSGREGAKAGIDWVGYGLKKLAATDPTTQGFVDNNGYADMMIGAEDLIFSGIVTATKPIILTSLSLTALQMQIAGGASPVDDTSGTSLVTGMRRGGHVPSGSLDYYHVDSVVIEDLAGLGDQDTAEKGEAMGMFRDRAGNELAFCMLHCEFGQTTPDPSSASGKLDFSGSQKTKTSRSVVFQEIEA